MTRQLDAGRCLRGAAVAAAMLSAFAPSAHAGTVAEDGGFGAFRLQSASLPAETMLNISLYNRILSMNTEVGALSSLLAGRSVTMPNGTVQPADLWASSHEAAMSISTHRFVEIHAALPMYSQDLYYNVGETRNSSIGDMRYGLKLSMPIGGRKSVLAAALMVGGSLPTSGNRTGTLPVPGRLEYYPRDTLVFSNGSRSAGTGRDDWHVGGAITIDLEQSALPLPVQFHVNAASRKTSALTPDDEEFFDVFSVGAGFEGKLSKYVSLLGEYWHENRLEASTGTEPKLDEISVGLNFHTPVGISVLLGAGFAVDNSEVSPLGFYNSSGVREYGFNMHTSPDAQIILALTYTARLSSLDKDGDGILDKDDNCPEIPEDKDGFEDKDGCPEDDNDHDGITDKKDKCPNDPEDKDGFEDDDGCPEADNDKDTLCDPWVMGRETVAKYASECRPTDKCPNEPQGPGGVDGCPNGDTDGDGIMNDKDKCPTDPEDKDGFQDDDGCPEPDNDGDGILDPQDKCPNEPETRNGYQDEDGCADVAPVQQKTLILRGVNFETGKAVLLPESYPILDDVAAQLVAAPEIEIEVSGHTDNVGGYEYNIKLSSDRAQSVASYLMQKGVTSSRLKVAGYGYNKPIASNRSAGGRLQNRRVEFNRIDKGSKQ